MEVKDPETFSPLENYQDTTSPQGKVRTYSKILLIVMFLYQKERRPYVCVSRSVVSDSLRPHGL